MNQTSAYAAHRFPRGFSRPDRVPVAWLFLALLFSAQGADPSPSAALDAYRKGQFQESQAQYSQLAKQNPEDARLRFNAGAAAYRLNDLTNAATWFESVLGNPDLRLQQQAYYNLGNARFRMGESLPDAEARRQMWSEALTNFVSAMKLDAADTNASANYSFVRQQLEQLERQMPPPQQQQQQKQKQQQQQKQDKQDSQKDNSQQQQDQDQQQQQDQESQDNSSPSGQSDPKQRQDPSQDQNSQEQKEGSQEGNEPREEPDSKKESGAKDSEKQDEQKGSGSKSPQEGKGQQSGEEGNPAEAAEATGEMTAAQAVQMLESQKGEEKALLFRTYGNAKEAAKRASQIRKPW